MMDAKFPDLKTGDVIQSVKKKRNRIKKKKCNLYTKDSEAEYLDPNSSLPLVKYNESQGKMMDARFPDPHTGDVIESVKVIDSIVLECEDSIPGGQEAYQLKKKWNAKEKKRNRNTSTEKSKPSSGGISENSSSSQSQSQVVESGSQAAHWFVWFRIIGSYNLTQIIVSTISTRALSYGITSTTILLLLI